MAFTFTCEANTKSNKLLLPGTSSITFYIQFYSETTFMIHSVVAVTYSPVIVLRQDPEHILSFFSLDTGSYFTAQRNPIGQQVVFHYKSLHDEME